MVPYKEFDLIKGKKYRITPLVECRDTERWVRTIHNLNKMFTSGHPITAIIPERELVSSEIEEYRVFFCKKAKEKKSNCIYFVMPVKVEEVDLDEHRD